MDLPILGQTIVNIDRQPHRLEFEMENGDVWAMFHVQDCCESVTLEDICGDLNDLIGTPLLVAYEETSRTEPPVNNCGLDSWEPESYTWTFYRLATVRGSVTLRWYGESNGYYSESADFIKKGDWSFR